MGDYDIIIEPRELGDYILLIGYGIEELLF